MFGRGDNLKEKSTDFDERVSPIGRSSEGPQLNLPNTLSIIRIAASPVLIVLLLNPGPALSLATAVLFILVCLTDWLDGYYARKLDIVTTLGKFLDPLADKLLVMTTLIMLIPLGRAPAWIVALILAREVAVTGLRAIASEQGVVIDASQLGKIKTVSQIVAIVPLLIHHTYYGLDFQAIGAVLLWVALALTLWSGIDYIRGYFSATSARRLT